MSSMTYEDYGSSLTRRSRMCKGATAEDRESARTESEIYVASAKSAVSHKSAMPRAERVVDDLYDESLTKNRITSPAAIADHVHVVLIDNSGLLIVD